MQEAYCSFRPLGPLLALEPRFLVGTWPLPRRELMTIATPRFQFAGCGSPRTCYGLRCGRRRGCSCRLCCVSAGSRSMSHFVPWKAIRADRSRFRYATSAILCRVGAVCSESKRVKNDQFRSELPRGKLLHVTSFPPGSPRLAIRHPLTSRS